MALTINTNIGSLNAQRNLNQTQGGLSKAMQRLSSGLRINSAKDDAAGLAISDRMTAQIRGLNQAVRNANDGISLAQTAEGALQETTNILQRMRELAVQASNDTNSDDDRLSLNAEFTALVEEVDRIASTTSFNGKVLLNGDYAASADAAVFQVGANAGQTIDVTIGDATAATLGVVAAVTDASGNVITPATKALTSIDIKGFSAAQAALNSLDNAISQVDTVRGDLGAVQNRFESTIANLSNVSENLSAARSRILDADIAAETSEMTKFNILQQAGVSILAQANQTPQLALSLLG